MLLKTLTLAAAATVALAACVTTVETPARIASLKLVPDGGVPGDYCKLRNSGATRVLDITFRNDGTGGYAGGDPLTVAFSTGARRAVTRTSLPSIPSGDTRTIAVPVPTACFNPDCEFSIDWANQTETDGFCKG